MAGPTSDGSSDPAPRAVGLLLAAVAVAVFLVSVTGLPNLLDNEGRLAAYVLDVLQNGNWVVQHDVTGDIASKPPLLTWLTSLATLPVGRLNSFSLYFASATAAAALSAALFAAVRTRFGWRAGMLAGLALVLSPAGVRAPVTARYDTLFALWIALAAFAAFRGWESGKGWLWFWIAAALATLVKGPLGLGLGAAGLLAVPWERRSGSPLPLQGSQGWGIALYVLSALRRCCGVGPPPSWPWGHRSRG